MPRQPRLDSPGSLHHVMGRGIEKTNIFRKDKDRADFVQRLASLSGKGALQVYAWALMPKHFHIDDRILGSSDFVESLLRTAEEKDRDTLRLTSKIRDLESLAREIIKREKMKTSELRSGCRKPSVLKARTLFCQTAVKKMGCFGAEVARYLKITTSAVNRRACADELPEAAEYFK